MENSKKDIELVEQPHGGAIRQGNPAPAGGWPGAGRPKDEIREMCAGGMVEGVHKLRALLADETKELSPEQLTRVTDVFGKYSVGTKTEVETVIADPEIISHIIAICVDECGVDRLKLVDRLAELELIEKGRY